jgi:hypothetical protein
MLVLYVLIVSHSGKATVLRLASYCPSLRFFIWLETYLGQAKVSRNLSINKEKSLVKTRRIQITTPSYRREQVIESTKKKTYTVVSFDFVLMVISQLKYFVGISSCLKR